MIKKDNIESITKVLLLAFIYFAITAVLYNIGSLFQFDFYRRDGNFFITYAPLLILSLVVFKCDSKKIMSTFLWVETIINLICMIVGLNLLQSELGAFQHFVVIIFTLVTFTVNAKNLLDKRDKEYSNIVNNIKYNSNIKNIESRVRDDMEKKYILILADGSIVVTDNDGDKVIGNALNDSLNIFI